MYGAARHLGAGVGQIDLDAPVQQAGVEQVQVGTVLLDVADCLAQHQLGDFFGVVVDIFHVAFVHAEHAETDVQISVRMLGLDLVPGPADALLADLADVFVASLIGLALFVAGLGQLHHDEFAATAVLGVELHDRVGSGGGAGEEVEDGRSFVHRGSYNVFH